MYYFHWLLLLGSQVWWFLKHTHVHLSLYGAHFGRPGLRICSSKAIIFTSFRCTDFLSIWDQLNLFLNFEFSRSVSSIHLKLQPGWGQNIKFELSKLKFKGNFDFSSLGPNKQIFKSFPLLMESVWKWKSLAAQVVKNPPSVQETWVRSLGWENLLEKGVVPTPVFLTGESHGQRSQLGYTPKDHSQN